MFGAGAAALMATAPQLDPEPVVPELLTVQVQEVLPKTVRLNVNSQGTVQPSDETQLIPEVSGKIEWTSEGLVAGGYFEQGDELARIETIDYETALERAEAAQLRAEAEFQHASFELKRVQSLEERSWSQDRTWKTQSEYTKSIKLHLRMRARIRNRLRRI